MSEQQAIDTAATNVALKARFPRIDDPIEAIQFALHIEKTTCCCGFGIDFLETWRDGAWHEIEQAYPEYLERVAA